MSQLSLEMEVTLFIVIKAYLFVITAAFAFFCKVAESKFKTVKIRLKVGEAVERFFLLVSNWLVYGGSIIFRFYWTGFPLKNHQDSLS